MEKDTDLERAIRRHQTAFAARNLEIELFWKRSLFFWGFVAATMVGYATAKERYPDLSVLLVCFGWICSLAWTLANRGSKFWYESWEQKTIDAEDRVTGPLLKSPEPAENKGMWMSARRFSVSKLAIGLSDFALLFWTAVLVLDVVRLVRGNSPVSGATRIGLLGFAALTVGFGVALVWEGRSSNASRG